MEKKMETPGCYRVQFWGLGFRVYLEGQGDLAIRLIMGMIMEIKMDTTVLFRV